MASLKQQILKQSQVDKEAFSTLSSLIQEALIAEATAVQTRIADGHIAWVRQAVSASRKKKEAA
jgi:hypothetical protein